MRTPVRRGGLALATVVHDPALAERPDLLDSTIGAAGLAIEIARLRVEVRRQLAEVEASRARIVTAGYEERRRLERDLHDGAQQRLVSIGLALRHLQGSSAAGARPRARRRSWTRSRARSTSCASSRAACGPPASTTGSATRCASSAARSQLQDARRGHRRALRGPDRDRGLLRGQRGARQRRQARPRLDASPSPPRAATAASSSRIRDDGVGRRGRRRRARAWRGSPTASPRSAAACRVASPPGEGTVIVAELPCGS